VLINVYTTISKPILAKYNPNDLEHDNRTCLVVVVVVVVVVVIVVIVVVVTQK